ncbi:MAG TPA: hypothetical protein VGC59_02310 [Solirubrobacteraceae bacterium]
MQLVALARHLQQRRPGGEVQRPAGVELEEVDRLADVGVGLRPRLGALAHGERCELRAPRPHPLRGAQQRGRAVLGGRRGPAREGSARRGHRGVCLRGRRARGERHDALRRGRVRRDELFAVAALVTDPDRHAHGQLERLQRRGQAGALAGAAQLEHRLVAKRLRRHDAASAAGGARSCSSGTPCA